MLPGRSRCQVMGRCVQHPPLHRLELEPIDEVAGPQQTLCGDPVIQGPAVDERAQPAPSDVLNAPHDVMEHAGPQVDTDCVHAEVHRDECTLNSGSTPECVSHGEDIDRPIVRQEVCTVAEPGRTVGRESIQSGEHLRSISIDHQIYVPHQRGWSGPGEVPHRTPHHHHRPRAQQGEEGLQRRAIGPDRKPFDQLPTLDARTTVVSGRHQSTLSPCLSRHSRPRVSAPSRCEDESQAVPRGNRWQRTAVIP